MLQWQSSHSFLRCSGSCARTCIRWAQKWQPIAHVPPRRAGRCPNQTVRCFLPGPQELWERLPMRVQADWCFRNLQTPGRCKEKAQNRSPDKITASVRSQGACTVDSHRCGPRCAVPDVQRQFHWLGRSVHRSCQLLPRPRAAHSPLLARHYLSLFFWPWVRRSVAQAAWQSQAAPLLLLVS